MSLIAGYLSLVPCNQDYTHLIFNHEPERELLKIKNGIFIRVV